MPMEWEKLTASQLRELPREQTVFFFSAGPLEDHGPHLPMALDLIEARELCRMAAERLEAEMPGWRGVIMPSAPLGIDANTCEIALTVRGHVLRDWLIDSVRGLERAGFFHSVCFTGHGGPRQLSAIEDASRVIARRNRVSRMFKRGRVHPCLIAASSGLSVPADVRRAPFWPDPLEHGGARDTAIALGAGATVSPAYASLPSVARGTSFLGRALARLRRSVTGYWGNPSEALASQGRAHMKSDLDELFPKLRAVWEGKAPPQLQFRSWYSRLLLNGSYAKAWLLAFMLILMLTAWFYLITAELLS